MIHRLRFTSCVWLFRLWDMVRQFLYLILGGLILTAACGKSDRADSPEKAKQKTFQVKGVVVGVKPAKKTVEIKHEEVPDYMPAMTMSFEVKDSKCLHG